MDAKSFRNQVLRMAEEEGFNFLLIVEGEIAQRGSMEEIIRTEDGTAAKPYASNLVKGAQETYRNLFDIFAGFPIQDPNNPEAMYISSKDIEGFYMPSGSDYYMTVATNQMEFMVVAGDIEDGGFPLINVTFDNSYDVIISTLAEVPDPDDPESSSIVTDVTKTIPIDTMVQTSLAKFDRLPSHVATELETFIIAVIRCSQE